jgi:hypothetical protein
VWVKCYFSRCPCDKRDSRDKRHGDCHERHGCHRYILEFRFLDREKRLFPKYPVTFVTFVTTVHRRSDLNTRWASPTLQLSRILFVKSFRAATGFKATRNVSGVTPSIFQMESKLTRVQVFVSRPLFHNIERKSHRRTGFRVGRLHYSGSTGMVLHEWVDSLVNRSILSSSRSRGVRTQRRLMHLHPLPSLLAALRDSSFTKIASFYRLLLNQFEIFWRALS